MGNKRSGGIYFVAIKKINNQANNLFIVYNYTEYI
jgi:hypothetical protein